MIQTIDKRKLTPVSEFESAGNITISEESMNLIENRIRKIYFNIWQINKKNEILLI